MKFERQIYAMLVLWTHNSKTGSHVVPYFPHQSESLPQNQDVDKFVSSKGTVGLDMVSQIPVKSIQCKPVRPI